MPKPFLTEDAKRAFTDAIHAVEAASGAELVVAVRRRSGSYRDGALTAAAAAAALTLAFLLFSPWSFRLEWFLAEPILAGVAAGVLAARSPWLLRLLTSGAARRERVATWARATFVEKGVHRTSRQSGMLFYVSLLEREAELVVDVGVEAAVRPEVWLPAVSALQQAVRDGEDGVAVAARLSALGALLGDALPRAAGQGNELADEVES